MTCQVLYDKCVIKDLDDISRRNIERMMGRCRKLAEDPFPAGVEKLAGRDRIYRIRQGDYRILCTVDHEAQRVLIHAIGHRREVYQRR